ncbi:hypothetical protein [Bradyrhizobium sp. Ai1a-2]|uniref:hypothetical protein n=1 Tax=Bradyrhizobium sp. Ai1a-2 TaxID=196490 RepID=UPI001267A038|nr:hypothetical protein [Bradyrhizobium sp. Ai1a-2]
MAKLRKMRPRKEGPAETEKPAEQGTFASDEEFRLIEEMLYAKPFIEVAPTPIPVQDLPGPVIKLSSAVDTVVRNDDRQVSARGERVWPIQANST